MAYSEKKIDWEDIAQKIQVLIDANKEIIPQEHIEWVQHYKDHSEYSMAVQYLFMELEERNSGHLPFAKEDIVEIGNILDLHDENEWCIGGAHNFWNRFIRYVENHSSGSPR